MMLSSKTLLGLLAAGWLAEALASTHGDIDAGVAAYNAGDSEAALTSYAAAEADLGERPEIHFNKGLALLAKDDKEGARKAFEHGTESEFSAVHASAEYQLGNLELDAEAFDAAIERYTKCLKLQPDHQNAKWNLELALLKKKQKEEEEEKKKKEEEEKNKDENKDETKDEEKKDENKDEEKKDEEKKDEKKDEEKKDEEKKDEQKPEDKPGDETKDEQKPDEQKGEQQQPQPQPLDRADLDKALEQLDAEDKFQLGRPQGRQVPVEKDW